MASRKLGMINISIFHEQVEELNDFSIGVAWSCPEGWLYLLTEPARNPR